MSVARMAETSQKETITEIGKLRGSRTQREALQKLDKQESAQSVFANVERVLLWLALGELALYALASFTLFGIARLMADDEEPTPPVEKSVNSETKISTGKEEFPDALDVSSRTPTRRSELATKTTTPGDAIDDTAGEQKTTRGKNPPGLRELREALRLVAFKNPPGHFKVDLRPDYLISRHMQSDRGDESTRHSVRAKLSLLDDASRATPEEFAPRLEK